MINDDYSADELQVHYEAALRLLADSEGRYAISIRTANNAKKRAFSKYMKSLAQTGKRIDKEMGRTVQAQDFFTRLDMLRKKKKEG